MVDDAGVTVTLATGGGGAAVTVTEAVPLFPLLEAVMTAAPTANAETRPLVDTFATLGFEDDQLIAAPATTAPVESFATAAKVVEAPTTSEAEDGATLTEATGAGATAVTETGIVAVRLSADALTVVEPTLASVTTPLVDTAATFAFAEDHEIVWPLIA
jgi:hypothetical protein